MKKYLENRKRDLELLIKDEDDITQDRAYLNFLKGQLYEIDLALMTLFPNLPKDSND